MTIAAKDYITWEDDVTVAIEQYGITRSDAQGLVEARESEVRAFFAQGKAPGFVVAFLMGEGATSAATDAYPVWAEQVAAAIQGYGITAPKAESLMQGAARKLKACHEQGQTPQAAASLVVLDSDYGTSSASDPGLTQVYAELSVEWARHHPDLFAKTYNGFFDQYKEGWKITAQARKGFITLCADRTN